MVGKRKDFINYFDKQASFLKSFNVSNGVVRDDYNVYVHISSLEKLLGWTFDEVIYLGSACELKQFDEISRAIEMRKRSKKITKQHLVDKSTELLNDFLEFKKRKTDPLVEISPQDDYLLGEMKKNLVDFTFYLNDYEEGVESE